MDDYSHFRGYLHSRTIRWSYGTMKGREGAKLQEELGASNPAELVERLEGLGFAGLFINRKGLPDRGRKELEWLLRIVPQVPIQGQDSDLMFLRLPTRR